MSVKLSIELVPRTSWFKNLRQELSSGEWDVVRRECYKAAGYRCEICGGVGGKHPVECHERWSYCDKRKVQTLNGVIALCPDCHMVKHIGLANIRGLGDKAVRHLASVNSWSIAKAERYVERQFEVHMQRSNYSWEVDMSWLENAGLGN